MLMGRNYGSQSTDSFANRKEYEHQTAPVKDAIAGNWTLTYKEN